MSAQQVSEAVRQLEPFSTCEVSDALIKLKLQTYGGLLPGIRRLSPHELAPGASDSKLVGPAFTCKMVDALREPEAPKLAGGHFIDQTPAGSVLVISTPSHIISASLGGLLARALSVKGVKGAVTSGLIRDTREMHDIDFPVWARGTSTLGQSPFTRPSEVQGDLHFSQAGGNDDGSTTTTTTTTTTLVVQAGDIVLADADGVVFVPVRHAERVAQRAKISREQDDRVRESIDDGLSVKASFDKWRTS